MPGVEAALTAVVWMVAMWLALGLTVVAIEIVKSIIRWREGWRL